jgi:hypothetical protein
VRASSVGTGPRLCAAVNKALSSWEHGQAEPGGTGRRTSRSGARRVLTAQTKKSRRTLALRVVSIRRGTFDPGSFTQSSKKIDLAWSVAVCAVNNEEGSLAHWKRVLVGIMMRSRVARQPCDRNPEQASGGVGVPWHAHMISRVRLRARGIECFGGNGHERAACMAQAIVADRTDQQSTEPNMLPSSDDQ